MCRLWRGDIDAQPGLGRPGGVQAQVAILQPVFHHGLHMLLLHGNHGEDQAPVGQPAHGARVGLDLAGGLVAHGGGAHREHAHPGGLGPHEKLCLVQRHLIGRHGKQATVGIQPVAHGHARKIRRSSTSGQGHVHRAQPPIAQRCLRMWRLEHLGHAARYIHRWHHHRVQCIAQSFVTEVLGQLTAQGLTAVFGAQHRARHINQAAHRTARQATR